MQFEESYFRGEELEGFFVEEKMKRAWAAQLEVLKGVERICGKYGLRYYAGYGTLLGAVRHKGFIPWDDDLDIFMLRDDYEGFLKVIQQEMEPGYALLNIYLEEDYGEVFSRIVNSRNISFTKEYLERYHACPYVVGVDIFPLDFIPRDPQEDALRQELYRYVLSVKRIAVDRAGCLDEELNDMLDQTEELCSVKISRDKTVIRQLIILLDRLSSLYCREESDEVAILHSNVNNFTRRMKVEWFDETIWMPFENTSIAVPCNYDECLKAIYGPSYMTPVQFKAHDYPFYRKQDEILEALMKETK